MKQRLYFRFQSCLDYLLRNAIGHCGDSQRKLHINTVGP
jgi:hypothetical protein